MAFSEALATRIRQRLARWATGFSGRRSSSGRCRRSSPTTTYRATRMKPIRFSCEETLDLAPEDIARLILDLAHWTDFKGFGVLPGIQAAEFEVRTPGVVGSRIRVTNTDGSSHVEEVVEWQPEHRLRLHMRDFSAPLSRLATGFMETWVFQRLDKGTRVERSFELHAKSAFARPFLWLISFVLKRAIARHLRQLRDLGQRQGSDDPS